MGESYRRLISTPADISTADTTALAERLAQNVQLQRDLAAQSPHVLQFTSDLQTTEGGFYVEHEPAIVPSIPIFSPDAAVAEEEDLLRWAIALADSLRAAHSHSKRIVHGGLCPGVILTTPEGVQKITDFGFAPSICAALGVDRFVNLCVENRARDSGDVKETGVWHIISPDVEHDDRICGFVDPQKYGNQTLHTFEPVSDIIGAGFLLHIMAENRHPYLHDNQDLRLPELAEAMAFFFYDGSRRKSLLNSSDERIKAWCEIVAKMLEHLPDDRPDAATISTRLVEVGVEPHSLGDAQMRELDALAVFIGEEKYEDARDRARALAGGAATEEITELAMSLLRSAEAGLRLAKASEILDTVDWRKARDELNAIDQNGLRGELVKKAEAVESALKGLTEIDDRISALESSFEQIAPEKPTTGDEAKQLHSELDTLLGELTKFAAEIELPASFLGRSDTLRGDLDTRLKDVQRTISTINADHSAARQWLAELQKAEKDEPRERVSDLLAGRKDLSIAHWPEDVVKAADATAKRIEEISQAESWTARLTTAVQDAEADDARLDAAQSCLADKPRISEWPQKLREDSDSLARRLGEVESKSADRVKAAQWLERILQAVAGEDWATANRELTAKPALRHWTDDAVAEEARLKPLIEGQLEEQERIEVWLQSAKGAGDAEDFATALGILDSPPVSKEKIPKSAKKQIAKWRKDFETKLAAARDRALKQRSEAIRDKARNLVGQVVKDDFSKFLLAESIETTVETVEWDSDDAASAGHGSFAVHVRFQGRNEAAPSIHEDLQFQLNDGLPQILNDQSLRDRLGAELRRIVLAHQTHTATQLAEPLRQGLFPEATVDTAIAEMSEQTSAKVSFLGSKAGGPAMETVVVWDAKRADWAYADPESVVQRAVDIVASVSRELLKPKLLESSNLLRQYSSVLQTDATAPPPPSPPAIPRSLTLEGRLTIHLDDDDSAPLMTFPVSCPRAGEVTVAVDLRPAEAKLSEFVVARQRTAQASVIKQLEGRLTGANVRCKLTPLVKRIKKPVDEVGFLLKPKRGEKVTVTANWNRDRFLFELGEQAETELKAVLNGAAAAVDDPATRKVDSAKEVTTSTGKRPAVVGVVALLAMAGAGYMFWPQADEEPSGGLVDTTPVSPTNDNSNPITLPANDNITDTGPAPVVNSNANDTPVDPNPNDNATTPPEKIVSADAAIQEVTNQLASSAYLRDFASSLVNREATIENGVATLGYRVPGLQPVDRQVSLVDRDGTWSILDGAQPVANLAQELTSLLDGDRSDQLTDVVHDVVNRKLGHLVPPGAVDVAGMNPQWEIDESSHTFWNGKVATAAITVHTETVTVSGLSFTARDGAVLLDSANGLRDDIETALNAAILANQVTAASEWRSGLENFPMPPEANLESNTDVGEEPQLEIRVRLSADNLIARQYTATWDPSSFTFEPPQEWSLTAGRFAQAAKAIERLNDKDQPLEWVQRIPTIGAFREREVQPPPVSELHLVTTAPWADGSDDEQDELPLVISLDFDSDPPMPRQWPLVVRYLELEKHPIIVGAADPANAQTTVWTGLPTELALLANAGLATIQLDATFEGKPRPIDDDSPQLNTQIVLSWHPSPSYTGMSAAAVTAGLDKLTDGNTLLYGFSLTPNGQDEPESHWQPDSTNGDIAAIVSAIQSFDKLLSDYPRRRELERKLANRVADGPPAEGFPGVALQDEDEALQLLQEIWEVKASQADIPVSADLTALSRTIRRNLKGYTKKGTASDKRPELTIFAEYFFGPQSAFAIVWSRSAGVDSKLEGPNLIHFGATDDLLPETGAEATLFDAVFDSVPVAVASQPFRAFAGSIGIVMGLDTPMDLLAEDPALVKISPRTSMLGDWDRVTAAPGAKESKWDSLQILRDKYPAKRSDFIFVSTLHSDTKSWVRTTDRASKESAQRARNALSKAIESVDSGG